MINDLNTQYIRTSDGLIGVIERETKCQIHVVIQYWSESAKANHMFHASFMKDSHRQVGTPSRTFDFVQSLSEV